MVRNHERIENKHDIMIMYSVGKEQGIVCIYVINTAPVYSIQIQMKSRVYCPKGPTCHAYAWQIGPFWQDTLEMA